MATLPDAASSPPSSHPPMTRAQRVAGVADYFLRVWRRTWLGSVMSRVLSPLLFVLAFGIGLGSLVDESSGGVGGVPYLVFVAPAMVAVQGMLDAANESMWPVYGLFTWNRMYHSMLAAPLTVVDLLLGHLSVIALQGTIGASAFVAVASLFGSFTSWWAVLCVPVGVLTCLAFATNLFAITSRASGDGVFNLVFRIVITPLMLFSGVFFPVSSLPLPLELLAWVTPLWHGVELSRDAASGSLDVMTPVHVVVLLTFVVVGFVLARRGLTRRLVS